MDEGNAAIDPFVVDGMTPMIAHVDLNPVSEAIRRADDIVDAEELSFFLLLHHSVLHISDRMKEVAAGASSPSLRFSALLRGLGLGKLRDVPLESPQAFGHERTATRKVEIMERRLALVPNCLLYKIFEQSDFERLYCSQQ